MYDTECFTNVRDPIDPVRSRRGERELESAERGLEAGPAQPDVVEGGIQGFRIRFRAARGVEVAVTGHAGPPERASDDGTPKVRCCLELLRRRGTQPGQNLGCE